MSRRPLAPGSTCREQALEDCPRYVPRTLEAWIASPELRLAAYGYTCRMINIDAILDRAMREGVQPDDATSGASTYRRTLERVREASAINRRWAGAEATRNLVVLARLEVKYRQLAEPRSEPGVDAALEILEPRHRSGIVERQELRRPHARHLLDRIDPVIGVGEPAPRQAASRTPADA